MGVMGKAIGEELEHQVVALGRLGRMVWDSWFKSHGLGHIVRGAFGCMVQRAWFGKWLGARMVESHMRGDGEPGAH